MKNIVLVSTLSIENKKIITVTKVMKAKIFIEQTKSSWRIYSSHLDEFFYKDDFPIFPDIFFSFYLQIDNNNFEENNKKFSKTIF